MTDLVKSVRVQSDPLNKSPNHLPVEIVEVEFAVPPGDAWMAWNDVLRFRCEKGQSKKLLVLLGLEQPELPKDAG